VPARSPQWLDDANGAARAGGYSLHAGIDIAPGQRARLERLCRDGTTHIVIEPLDFMAQPKSRLSSSSGSVWTTPA